MMVSVAQTIKSQMIEWSMYNEFEGILKEGAMAWFNVLSWYLLAGTEKNHEKPVTVASFWAKIQTLKLP
jgi:hypothetical protein